MWIVVNYDECVMLCVQCYIMLHYVLSIYVQIALVLHEMEYRMHALISCLLSIARGRMCESIHFFICFVPFSHTYLLARILMDERWFFSTVVGQLLVSLPPTTTSQQGYFYNQRGIETRILALQALTRQLTRHLYLAVRVYRSC